MPTPDEMYADYIQGPDIKRVLAAWVKDITEGLTYCTYYCASPKLGNRRVLCFHGPDGPHPGPMPQEYKLLDDFEVLRLLAKRLDALEARARYAD